LTRIVANHCRHRRRTCRVPGVSTAVAGIPSIDRSISNKEPNLDASPDFV
jgi:hypothetical protein